MSSCSFLILLLLVAICVLLPVIHAEGDPVVPDDAGGDSFRSDPDSDGSGSDGPYDSGDNDPNLEATMAVSWPTSMPIAPKPQDIAASAASAVGMSHIDNQDGQAERDQTPFSSSGEDDFIESVSDLLDKASSLASALQSSSASGTTSAITAATIDPSLGCSIFATLHAACASAFPPAWGIPSASITTTITQTPPPKIIVDPDTFGGTNTSWPFITVTSTSTAAPTTQTQAVANPITTIPPNVTDQASCVCYSSSYYVPEVWSVAASVCASGGPVEPAAMDLCGKNVRGWSSANFDQVKPTSSDTPAATAAVTQFGAAHKDTTLNSSLFITVALLGYLVSSGLN